MPLFKTLSAAARGIDSQTPTFGKEGADFGLPMALAILGAMGTFKVRDKHLSDGATAFPDYELTRDVVHPAEVIQVSPREAS